MERTNSGDLVGPDAGKGWDVVMRDGVGTVHSSLTLKLAPSTIPTGGLDIYNNAITPSSAAEEVEKIRAKEIKRCLFNHGHHQTVSMNSIDSFKYDNFSGQDNATRTSPDQAIKRPIICIYGLLLLHLLHLLLLLHLCINALHL